MRYRLVWGDFGELFEDPRRTGLLMNVVFILEAHAGEFVFPKTGMARE